MFQRKGKDIFSRFTYSAGLHIQPVYIFSRFTYSAGLHIQPAYIFSRFTYSAGLHVPNKRFFLLVLFKRLFFLADLSRKKGFQSVKSPYFCVGQQKKKRTAQKKTGEENRYFRTYEPANYSIK